MLKLHILCTLDLSLAFSCANKLQINSQSHSIQAHLAMSLKGQDIDMFPAISVVPRPVFSLNDWMGRWTESLIY